MFWIGWVNQSIKILISENLAVCLNNSMLKRWKILHQQHGICLVPASATCLLFWSGSNNKGSLFNIGGNWRISTWQGHNGQVSTLVKDGLIYKTRQWPDLGPWTLNMPSCNLVSEKGLTYCHSSLLIQKALCFQQCAGNYLVPVLCGCPQAPAWCLAKFWCVEAPAGWR